jgi:hypothetical protein
VTVEVRLPGIVTKADAKVGPSDGGAFISALAAAAAAAAGRATDAGSEDERWYDPAPLARLSSRSSASSASTLNSVYWDPTEAFAVDPAALSSACATPRTPLSALSSWAPDAGAGAPRAPAAAAAGGGGARALEPGTDPVSLPGSPTAGAAERAGGGAAAAAAGRAGGSAAAAVVEAPVEYVLRRYKQVWAHAAGSRAPGRALAQGSTPALPPGTGAAASQSLRMPRLPASLLRPRATCSCARPSASCLPTSSPAASPSTTSSARCSRRSRGSTPR